MPNEQTITNLVLNQVDSRETYEAMLEPTNTSLFWIDSANGDIIKFYNGTAWTATSSVWS